MEGKNISYAGKVILVKQVSQEILNYAMSIYKFPENMCKEIDGLLRNYWWGANQERKKNSTRLNGITCVNED